MLVELASVLVTESDVNIAWETMRCLILAEAIDPSLENDLTHQEAIRIAKDRFKQRYREWALG